MSPYEGRLLGMALNQFMLPGYAAFNIGLVAKDLKNISDAQTFECAGTGIDPDQIVDEFDCSADESEEIERVGFGSENMSEASEND